MEQVRIKIPEEECNRILEAKSEYITRMVVVNKCIGQMMYEAEPKANVIERILNEALKKLVEYRKVFDEIVSKYIDDSESYTGSNISIDVVSCEIICNI